MPVRPPAATAFPGFLAFARHQSRSAREQSLAETLYRTGELSDRFTAWHESAEDPGDMQAAYNAVVY